MLLGRSFRTKHHDNYRDHCITRYLQTHMNDYISRPKCVPDCVTKAQMLNPVSYMWSFVFLEIAYIQHINDLSFLFLHEGWTFMCHMSIHIPLTTDADVIIYSYYGIAYCSQIEKTQTYKYVNKSKP